VRDRLSAIGCDPVEVLSVRVATQGGPEAAARDARYTALSSLSERHRAVVLLGHTLDDQAETVLLGLARGSGLRSLSGMAPARGLFRRPLLGVTRSQTSSACAALGLAVWQDPSNADCQFARARVRQRVLPVLEDALGPGVAAALARTADLARADADALDALADGLATKAVGPDGAASVEALAQAPAALRRRVLRGLALAAGCPAGDLSAVHLEAMDSLIVDWHGQQRIDIPGSLSVRREGGRLRLSARVGG
jgi:tRNA(Ile)-lysidine synthase